MVVLGTCSITSSSDTISPSTPTNPGATAYSSPYSQINIGWNYSTDNVGVAGYKIYRNGTFLTSVACSGYFYDDKAVTPGTTYAYTVAAYDTAGNISAQSVSVSATAPVSGGGGSTGDTQPPSTPTGLSTTAYSSSQINLFWTASTDNVSVAGYKIYRNGTSVASVVSSTALSYSDTGLSAATSYSYTVAAYDAAGNVSAQTQTLSATTFGSVIATSTTSSYNSYIKGSVLDASGLPVGSVGVHVYKSDFSLNFGGMTSANGTFSVNLPGGDYFIEIYPPYGRYDLVKPEVVKVSVASGETKSLTLRFTGTTKTITGKVLFSNGQPVADAQVGAFSLSTYQWTSTVTDAGGNYTLNVGSGKWQVGVRPAVSAKWSYSGPFPEVEFVNNNLLETKVVNFSIPVADAGLTVKTIDQFGNAIAGAGIVVDTVSAGQQSLGAMRPPPQYANGDASGSATFTLRAGTYFVRAFLPPDQGFLNPEEQMTSVASGDKKQLNLVFRKRDASTTVAIKGITKLGDGTPIDAFVWAWSEKGGFSQTHSLSDGSFTIQVSPNTTWHIGAGKELNGLPYKAGETVVVVIDVGTSVELILAKLTDIFLAPNVNITQSATQQVIAQAQDGARMTLPPSAAAASGNINVNIDPTIEAPSQAGARTIGTVYDIKATDQSGNQIKSLQSEAEIVLPYNKDDLKKQGVTEDNIVPSYFDDSVGAWKPCENYTIDKQKSVAVCRVKHLTRFAIVAAADIVPPDSPTGVKVAKNASGEIVISWVNPTKDFSNAKVYRSTEKGTLGQIVLDNVAISQGKDKTAASGVIYYYTVRAVDPAGNESANVDQASIVGTGVKATVKFARNLTVGSRGDDVTSLQQILSGEGVYPEALVTGYFGQKTKAAVVRFQEKYVSEILAPVGLIKGTGFVGSGSRAKLNVLYKINQ